MASRRKDIPSPKSTPPTDHRTKTSKHEGTMTERSPSANPGGRSRLQPSSAGSGWNVWSGLKREDFIGGVNLQRQRVPFSPSAGRPQCEAARPRERATTAGLHLDQIRFLSLHSFPSQSFSALLYTFICLFIFSHFLWGLCNPQATTNYFKGPGQDQEYGSVFISADGDVFHVDTQLDNINAPAASRRRSRRSVVWNWNRLYQVLNLHHQN